MRVHVLDSPRAGVYRGVVHMPTPAGANTVGVTWKALVLAVRPPGTLSAASAGEQAAHEAGDLVELPLEIALEPSAMSIEAVQAALTAMADQAEATFVRQFEAGYRYWGYSYGTVN